MRLFRTVVRRRRGVREATRAACITALRGGIGHAQATRGAGVRPAQAAKGVCIATAPGGYGRGAAPTRGGPTRRVRRLAVFALFGAEALDLNGLPRAALRRLGAVAYAGWRASAAEVEVLRPLLLATRGSLGGFWWASGISTPCRRTWTPTRATRGWRQGRRTVRGVGSGTRVSSPMTHASGAAALRAHFQGRPLGPSLPRAFPAALRRAVRGSRTALRAEVRPRPGFRVSLPVVRAATVSLKAS